MRKSGAIDQINLITIFLMVIWKPFGTYILRMSGHTMIIAILSVMVLAINLSANSKKTKQVLSYGPTKIWTILMIYSIANSQIKGFSSDGFAAGGAISFFLVNYIMPFTLLLLCLLELKSERKRCLDVLMASSFIFVLITLMNSTIGGDIRYDKEAIEIGNQLPLTAVSLLYILMTQYVDGYKNIFYLVAGLALCTYLVYSTTTRSAFGAEVILIVGTALFYMKGKSTKSKVYFILLGAITFFAMSYFFGEGSAMAERIDEEENRGIILVRNNDLNNFLVKLLGVRAEHLLLGLDTVPLYYPITGIGILNFMEVTGYHHRLHMEYIVQLCENGIIGFVLLMIMYIKMGSGLKKLLKNDNGGYVHLFGFITLIFLNLSTWTYCLFFAMIFYAVILDSISRDSIINLEKNKS